MSYSQKEKLKSLFQGLGRSTNRGIRKCPKCGTVTGTRGNQCKNRACDVLFRKNDSGATKKTFTDACRIETSFSGVQVFSVRQRDRGPDYRSFVQLPASVKPSANGSNGAPESNKNLANVKCYKPACNKNKSATCEHIEAAKRCFSEAEPLQIKQSAVSSLNIPTEQQQIISIYLNETTDPIVQRVSKTSFVVKCDVSKNHPIGFLHVMFVPNKKEERIDKRFLCSCKPLRSKDGDVQNVHDSGEASSKFCVHYHACLWAFASDSNLSSEFNDFLSQSGNCAPTLLSQLHLVTLPQTVHTTSLDTIDASQISVEIMQDNMSLLESIAAVDDVTLHNVQGLEGVLSDQIIVTNVEDSLSFGDTSALEGLDDSDSQVCQIFAAGTNTIQLSSPFTISESLHHQAVSITTTNAPVGTSLSSTIPIESRKRKHDEELHNIVPVSSATGLSHSSQVQTITLSNGYNKEGHSKSSETSTNSLPTTTIQFNASELITFPASQQGEPGQPLSSTHQVENGEVDEFEMWLAGVNERLNAMMNYQFSGKPDPVVYYVSSEYFDRLKERITSGDSKSKKKRLPNQTTITTRTDKPPVGNFIQHVWKITSLNHVLQIFRNQLIPLQICQYFIKGPNGLYEKWSPPNAKDDKNQPIQPHVHRTFLKVGRNDSNSSESVPFVIEWIPEILPQSKLGELTLTFEFGHSTPNTREKSSNS